MSFTNRKGASGRGTRVSRRRGTKTTAAQLARRAEYRRQMDVHRTRTRTSASPAPLAD